MKPVAFESGALPAHEARTRLRDRLRPGQTVYLTKRHQTRRAQFVELGIVVLVPPRSPAAVSGPAIDLSEDVADAFHWQLGPSGGVVLKQRSGEDLPETGAWVIACLNRLCEFSTPETSLKLTWL